MLNRSRSEVLNLAVALKGTGSDHQDGPGEGKTGRRFFAAVPPDEWKGFAFPSVIKN